MDYYYVWSPGWDLLIGLYLKIPEKFELPFFQDRFLVVHIPFVCMNKFKFLARFSVDHFVPSSCAPSYTLGAHIYCIRLLCDWSFCICHPIIYIYNFLRLINTCLDIISPYGFFLFCFLLLSEEIQFLSKDFLFLAISKISLVCHLKCPQSYLSSHFRFLVIFILLMLVFLLLFLMVVIDLPLRFFYVFFGSYQCIDAIFNACEIIIIIIIPCKFFTPSLADGLSLEYQW